MPIERCTRCERYIDLDWHSGGEYIDLDYVCEGCLTDQELKDLEDK